MADIRKFQTNEVLNKVLNTGEDALKVDIDNVTLTTEGGDVAIDVALDKANDTITVFSNTAKDGSGTSFVPLVDSDGHLQVDALSTALPSGAATAANQATIIGHVDGVETLITSSNTKLDTLETTLTAIETDAAAIETLLTGIDADTDAIKTDAAAIEILITSTNSKIDTFDAVLDNILVKNTEIDTVLDNIKTDTQAIETDMAAIETLLTAANVDHAANEALLTTIDSDTNDIKTATESSNTHLGNMFYDTALAVTPSDSSDLSGEPYFAVWVGTGGNLKVDMSSGTGTVTLNNCASGQLIPIMVERIYATGTTASNIIVFK
jgi:hypothetical protein